MAYLDYTGFAASFFAKRSNAEALKTGAQNSEGSMEGMLIKEAAESVDKSANIVPNRHAVIASKGRRKILRGRHADRCGYESPDLSGLLVIVNEKSLIDTTNLTVLVRCQTAVKSKRVDDCDGRLLYNQTIGLWSVIVKAADADDGEVVGPEHELVGGGIRDHNGNSSD